MWNASAGRVDVTVLPFDGDALQLALAFFRARAELHDARFGTEALAAYVAELSQQPAKSAASFAAAGLARRTLDGDGPAALARLVRAVASPLDPKSPEAASRADAPPAGSVRIEHLGHACFRFTASDGARLLVDPYSSRYWLRLRFPWIGADFVVSTHDHPDHAALDEVLGAPLLVASDDAEDAAAVQDASAGPFHVRSIRTKHDRRYGVLPNRVVRIEIENMSFVHLGDVQAPLTEDLCKALGPVDVLFAPIDDRGHVLDGAALTGIVERLAPRILVPMHYRVSAIQGEISDLGGIDAWLASAPRVKRINAARFDLTKRDLPSETQTWVPQPRAWPEGRLEATR